MTEFINPHDIPGATPLDNEALEGLLPKYITTRKELNDAEFKNISETVNKYFTSKKTYLFTIENLYKLHKEMFYFVWKWAGNKRKKNYNIGVDFPQIEIELKKLLDDFNFWEDHQFKPLEIASRLHHRLVKIHPFNNGNGRWARLMANIYLKQVVRSYIAWPEDELFVTTVFRKEYISALQNADKGNYDKLIEIHKKYLKKLGNI